MDLLQALQDSSSASALRGATTLYPFLNAAHILSVGLIVGAIGTLDVRVLGLFKGFALGQLGPPLSRVAAFGVLSAILTGVVIVSVQPVAYVQNPAFLLKLALAGLAVLNAVTLHSRMAWHDALESGEADVSVKVQAAASLSLWVMAVIAGRWIAFVE